MVRLNLIEQNLISASTFPIMKMELAMQAVYLPIKLLSSFSSKFDISYHQNKDIFTKNYGILYVSPFAPSQPNVMKQEELKIENVAEKGGINSASSQWAFFDNRQWQL